MLGNEFANRAKKLQQEQKERAEKARRKAEQERLLQARLAQRREEEEDQKRQQRLAAAAQQEAERQAQDAALEANGGVWWRAQLAAVTLAADAARQKGIKRGADKILLPRTVGDELMAQDAPKNGPMFFELRTPAGRTAHAGLLEFGAREGCVALPPHVERNLWGVDGILPPQPAQPDRSDAASAGASSSAADLSAAAAAGGSRGGSLAGSRGGSAADVAALDDMAVDGGDGLEARRQLGPVTVTYHKLPKGTFVRFQPRTADFQKEVGEFVREALEVALAAHATLSEGEWLAAEFAGRSYDLRVQQLRPGPAVSVIDTDMEAEVEPSVETEQRVAAEKAADQARLAQLAASALEEARARQAAEEHAAQAAADRERVRSAKEAALPPEPAAGGAASEAVTAVLVRLPDGSRASRRFLRSAPVQQLFDFVDAKGGGGQAPGGYQLVAQFPRRVLAPGQPGSLEQAGLTGAQEALMLQPLEEPRPPQS